jgi:hypothetical protein
MSEFTELMQAVGKGSAFAGIIYDKLKKDERVKKLNVDLGERPMHHAFQVKMTADVALSIAYCAFPMGMGLESFARGHQPEEVKEIEEEQLDETGTKTIVTFSRDVRRDDDPWEGDRHLYGTDLDKAYLEVVKDLQWLRNKYPLPTAAAKAAPVSAAQ